LFLQRRLKVTGKGDQATQGIRLFVDSIHCPVVGIPGVIGQKGQGQTK
jgi:hypothetical protein